MKVYVVVRGANRIKHIFANRVDAEMYEGGDEVIEWDVLEHPIEQRTWHGVMWTPKIPDRDSDNGAMSNPHTSAWQKDFTGSDYAHVTYHWASRGQEVVLCVQGWDPQLVHKLYTEQRAQYEAEQ